MQHIHIADTNSKKPYNSWIWKEIILPDGTETGYWDAPVKMPKDHKKIYVWDEEKICWKEKI